MVEQMLQRNPAAQVTIYVPQLFLFDQSLLYSALQQLARGGGERRQAMPFDLVLYSSSTTDAERMALRARPVSYTHLDVYKRQVIRSVRSKLQRVAVCFIIDYVICLLCN